MSEQKNSCPLDQESTQVGVDFFRIHFEAGRFADVTQAFERRAPIQQVAVTATAHEYVVGSYSYLGDLLRAEQIFKDHEKSFSSEQKAVALFALFVTSTRFFKIDQAREKILRLCDLFRSDRQNLRLRFYTYFALAFYRYTYGRSQKAHIYAEHALSLAYSLDSTYEQFIALDLLGHATLQVGRVDEGFNLLDRATAKAETLGRGAMTQAAELTKDLYRSTYGMARDLNGVLLQKRGALDYPDAYSQAQIDLEIVRNYTLMGQPNTALALLNDSRMRIFSLNNVRLQMLAQLRHAEICFKLGQNDQARLMALEALHFLQKNNNDTDLRLQTAFTGFLFKVNQREKILSDDADEMAFLLLRSLTRKNSSHIAQRILRRMDPRYAAPWIPRLSDPLGDIIDDVHAKTSRAFESIFAHGLWGLLPDYLNLPHGQDAIIFDIEPQSMAIFCAGDVTYESEGLTPMQRRCVEFLYAGPTQLESLVEAVWEEKYHPLRHNPLVSTFWMRLKDRLQNASTLLVRNGNEFYLRAGCVVRAMEVSATILPPLPAVVETSEWKGSHLQDQLNVRQMRFLKKCALDGDDSFDVQDYLQFQEVSLSTAQRDIRELTDLGLIKRRGKGRLSKYVFDR